MKVDANAIYKEIADCCGKNEIDMLCEDLAVGFLKLILFIPVLFSKYLPYFFIDIYEN